MAESNFQIRTATPADAAVIADFNAAIALESEGLELGMVMLRAGVEALLTDSAKGRYFVATVDDRIVGQLMHTWEWSDWRNGMFWWIQSVYVLPDYRRAGIFAGLYGHLETLAKAEATVCGLRLYVEQNNERAQQTYIKCGMSRTHYLLMEDDYRYPPTE